METILLVDDEADILALAREMLEGQGFEILDALNAEEAVRVAVSHTGPIHLLLTDVVMPGASGAALGEQLVAQHPGLTVVYMSGYTEEAIVQHGVLKPGIAFLHKPFTSDTLGRKLRDALER